jgi:spermidine/putrescine transport system substrate-binding protein
MKKVISLSLSILMILSTALAFSSCEKSEESSVKTLYVYNWGEYISDGSEDSLDVIKAFEEVSGIDVNYDDSTASNEAMYSKLKSGAVSVDIVIPSDYMIQRMIGEGMLQKVDTSKISNYKYIDPKYKGQYFDPKDEYSVPYNVGLVGVIYDSTVVTETPDSWSIMWDEKYAGDILNFNNPRDSFATAQFYLGLDINSTDRAEWDKAAEKLKEQNSVLQGRVMDEIFNKMEGGNAAVAPYYAGDFLTMQDVNPDLEFFYPKEGTNIFIDSMCIPSSAQNYEAALMFINFMLEPDVGLANAEYLCYATPNTAVLNNDEYSLKDNKYLYPEELPPVEYYHDLDPEIRAYYESLWEEIVR